MNKHEEKLLREYIQHNLRSQDLLNEGVKDVLKKALSSALKKIDELIGKLKSFVPASEKVITALEKNGAKEFVSKIETMGQEFESSIDAAADAVPSKMGESRYRPRRTRYTRNKRVTVAESIQRRRALNEVVLGGFEIVGFILAAVGGLPLLLTVLEKLVGWMGFKSAAKKISVAHEKAHHFEEMVVDYVIPDKALYVVYLIIEEEKNPDEFANLKIYQSDTSDLGGESFKSTHSRKGATRDDPGGGKGKLRRSTSSRGLKRSMTLEEFRESEEKQKYEKRAWAIVLLPWLISGLFSLHHMFHGILGALEGAATGVKAIEVGTAAAEAVPTIAGEIGSAMAAIAKA